jgi:hydroxymethylpyrimidine pyrophosphatase-like HAD family hydrolase
MNMHILTSEIFVRVLNIAAFGYGNNDCRMLKIARIGIAVTDATRD